MRRGLLARDKGRGRPRAGELHCLSGRSPGFCPPLSVPEPPERRPSPDPAPTGRWSAKQSSFDCSVNHRSPPPRQRLAGEGMGGILGEAESAGIHVVSMSRPKGLQWLGALRSQTKGRRSAGLGVCLGGLLEEAILRCRRAGRARSSAAARRRRSAARRW